MRYAFILTRKMPLMIITTTNTDVLFHGILPTVASMTPQCYSTLLRTDKLCIKYNLILYFTKPQASMFIQIQIKNCLNGFLLSKNSNPVLETG